MSRSVASPESENHTDLRLAELIREILAASPDSELLPDDPEQAFAAALDRLLLDRQTLEQLRCQLHTLRSSRAIKVVEAVRGLRRTLLPPGSRRVWLARRIR